VVVAVVVVVLVVRASAGGGTHMLVGEEGGCGGGGGGGDGGKGWRWGRHACVGRGFRPCPGSGSRPGRLAPQHFFFGAWIPPLEDDACHVEHLQQ